MEVTGSWMVTTFADAPFEWDIALEPGNTDQVHHVFADGIVASANTKNAEAAWKLIKFLSTDATAAKIRLGFPAGICRRPMMSLSRNSILHRRNRSTEK